jgi:hypothetical protein
MSDYKTLKEMAKAIGLNYSTARGYVERFPQYFVTRDIPGVRWPVYDAEAQAVLKLIMDTYDDDGQTHNVLAALEDRYGTIIPEVSPESDGSVSSAITARVTREIELLKSGQVGIDYALSSLRFYQELVRAKDAEIRHLRAEIERLRDGTNHLDTPST